MAAGEFPFNRPEGSALDMFIQWKNTELCADFNCDCGYQGHYDGLFASRVRCPGCGAVYELGTQVIAKRIEDDDRAVTFYDSDEDSAAARAALKN